MGYLRSAFLKEKKVIVPYSIPKIQCNFDSFLPDNLIWVWFPWCELTAFCFLAVMPLVPLRAELGSLWGFSFW